MIRYELAGKAALVTGGASGSGLALATQLARNGAKVAINHLADDERGHGAPACRRAGNRLRGLRAPSSGNAEAPSTQDPGVSGSRPRQMRPAAT